MPRRQWKYWLKGSGKRDCLLSAPQILRIDHFRTRWTAENRFAPVSRRRGSGRFHQVFNYSGSGENLVDTGGRYTVEAGYSPHVHSSVMPSLCPLPCRRSRINYARYLHTKRPGKIKNTNSDREAPPRLHLVRSLTPRQPHPVLHTFSRELSPALSFSRSLRPTSFSHIPAVALPEAVLTLSHYSAGPPIL